MQIICIQINCTHRYWVKYIFFFFLKNCTDTFLAFYFIYYINYFSNFSAMAWMVIEDGWKSEQTIRELLKRKKNIRLKKEKW